MKIALVINPKAGTIRSKDALIQAFGKKASELLPLDEFRIFPTQHAGHATILAKQCAENGFDICIAAGGDGTMNEVACGLTGSQTALGIVPLGSGNGLARHLKISLDPVTAFTQMLLGTSQQMDVGLVNGRKFFLASGIGFEGVVSHRFAGKTKRGFLQYILSSAETFFQFKPIKVTGLADGTRLSSTVFTLTMANGSEYGNGAIISPGSQVDDGLLQLIRIRPFPVWSSITIFFRLMTGNLEGSQYFDSLGFKRLRIDSDISLKGHIDGEPVEFGQFIETEIIPKGIWVRHP
ncbi:MAG TPA: diacylglycerol kinase family protein [Catalimonadaceae bacterium]|nr:diacylglycerol kinase family protein [Catalimonadaceae bacterium]HPI09448.1 diacylglycerol kinase family protein [Catalimonadaceae bacterium]